MARGNLPAQTPVVPKESFVAFDLLYRHVADLSKDLDGVLGTNLTKRVFLVSQTGQTFGPGGLRLLKKTVPAGTIQPGALVQLSLQTNKYAPFAGGHGLYIKFIQGATAVTVLQSFPPATQESTSISLQFQMSADRRWGFFRGQANINSFGTPVPASDTLYGLDKTLTNSDITIYQHARSGLAFSSYSSPPFVETVLIDFDQPFDVVVDVDLLATESIEIIHASLAITYCDTDSGQLAKTVFYGDSMTSMGDSNSFPSQVCKLRPGRSMVNHGLGGQLATSIVNRLVRGGYAARQWDCVLWIGENDASGDQNAWWTTIKTQIDRAIAFRGSRQRLIIVNLLPNVTWGASIQSALLYVNSQLATTYGSIVADVHTALATSGGQVPAGKRIDDIHLNTSGNADVAAVLNAKMTALGWP